MSISKCYLKWSLFISTLLSFANAATAAEIISFEDLYPGYEMIDLLPVGYAGFSWSDSADFVTKEYVPGTGYENGTIDSVSMYNDFARDLTMSRASAFNFNGAYITAAWNQDEKVTVEGWRNDTLQYVSTINTTYSAPTYYNFDFQNINRVVFRSLSEDGVNAGLGGEGAHIVIDNINYSPVAAVPEPSNWLLLAIGAVALIARRRARTCEEVTVSVHCNH